MEPLAAFPRLASILLRRKPARSVLLSLPPRRTLVSKPDADAPASAHAQPAAAVSQDVGAGEKSHFERVEAASRAQQTRSPWTRADADLAPVRRDRQAGAMTKGKLLTTPSRMLKLILPLTTRNQNDDRRNVEPLALLVHPQQPLSYLARLIQSELPFVRGEKDAERAPSVQFRAEDRIEGEEALGKREGEEEEEREGEGEGDGPVERKTGDGESNASAKRAQDDPPLSDEEALRARFVRWSPSTEIGDFIRDAARGKEFAIDVESASPIYVGVPSFKDRTFYLRMRLRKSSTKIAAMADIKQECDRLAHQSAQRVAQAGFLGLLSWWGVVYYLTFQTHLGWDVMEPVTYLVGLSGLMSGYMWFLYHNREVSYRSALHYTVSRRQHQLYRARGFDLATWERLVEEGNRLRREVRLVADEYDVEWDDDEVAEGKVSRVLREERKKGKGGKKEEEEDEKEEQQKKK